MRRALGGLLILVLLGGASLAAAEEIQSLDRVRETVRHFLEEATQEYRVPPRVEIGHLDSRLRLAACEVPLETFLPGNGRTLGNVTVGVRCNGLKPWSIYVPAQVKVYDRVVVTARSLPRGTVLGRADVELAERDLGALTNGYLLEPSEAVGKTLKRSVRLGLALNPGLIEAPRLVRRGDKVVIIANTGGLEVRMEGEALDDGAQGDTIRVRNNKSRREVEGIVTAAGQVEVRM